MLISLDTELTGLDLDRGSRPFLVTVCREDGTQVFWEWDVDPFTRAVHVPPEDAEEIRREVANATEIVGQNLKIDCEALSVAGIVPHEEWPWEKCHDTLVAGHLLASGLPHDLTSMVLHYTGHDIKPLEDALREAVLSARRLVDSKKFLGGSDDGDDLFDEGPQRWHLSKEGDPELPSAGSQAWRGDYWLPRAVAKYLGRGDGGCTVVNRRDGPFDVDIGRPGKWGNPFRVSEPKAYEHAVHQDNGDAWDRDAVVRRYREWVQTQPQLMKALPELAGKRLGCWCKPLLCHGDVLADLVRERCADPWYSVCSKYANADSAYTLLLWKRMREELVGKGLWPVYKESRRLPQVITGMQRRGVTYDLREGERLRGEYVAESLEFAAKCVTIARDQYQYDLVLAKGAAFNDSMRRFCFGLDKCQCRDCGREFVGSMGNLHKCKAKKCGSTNVQASPNRMLDLPVEKVTDSGNPSFDKDAVDWWEANLPDGPQLDFVLSLSAKRKRETTAGQLAQYKKFGVPTQYAGIVALHPNLNQTGTSHLRMSSNNPNGQNCGKQKKPCKDCGMTGEVDGRTCQACKGEGELDYNVRRAFRPAPGREFWALDYENIELRIPAYVAGERIMIELFEKPDEPPFFGSQHLLNASIVYPELFWPLAEKRGAFKKQYASTEYQWIKNFDFALAYQCGEAQGDRTAKRRGAWRKVKSTFRELDKLAQSQLSFARKNGYVLTLPDKDVPCPGYPLMTGRGASGDVSPTIPMNYFVSGCAMWSTRKAMLRCQAQLDEWNRQVLAVAGLQDATIQSCRKYLDLHGYHMSLQVHDELLFDFPAGGRRNLARAYKLKQLMEKSGDDIDVPLSVAVSWHPNTWAEGEELPKPQEIAA